MERLTYVTEDGTVLFHPKDFPENVGMTITQIAKDGRYKALEEIAERLANREQAEEQGLLLWLPRNVGDKENGAFTGMELAQIAAMQMKLKEYQSIGTVEECRIAVERMQPKKPIYIEAESVRYTDSYRCPACGGTFAGTGIAGYCYRCGQAIDWGKE